MGDSEQPPRRKSSSEKKDFLTACSRGDLAVVRQIIPLSAKNGGPRRRSSIAIIFGSKPTPDHKDEEGNVGMHLAALYNHVNVMEYLVQAGFETMVNAKNKHTGATPMMLAAKHGHIEAVAFCLDHMAELDIIDISGRTALHHAAKSSRIEVVELLLTRGANPCIKNSVGHTADYQCDHYPTTLLIQSAQKPWEAREAREKAAQAKEACEKEALTQSNSGKKSSSTFRGSIFSRFGSMSKLKGEKSNSNVPAAVTQPPPPESSQTPGTDTTAKPYSEKLTSGSGNIVLNTISAL